MQNDYKAGNRVIAVCFVMKNRERIAGGWKIASDDTEKMQSLLIISEHQRLGNKSA
jgi:hypothetical protein